MWEDHVMTETLHALTDGKTILFPTDTIWGLGCDATDEAAVKKIYTLKNRPKDKALIVLVSDIHMLKKHVNHIHPRIQTLLAYHVRPLTVIYNQGIGIAPSVTAGNNSIAIRIVKDPFCKELIEKFGKPIVATSANVSDQAFPENFGEISSTILTGIDFVVPYRQMEKSLNLPSVIVKMSKTEELIFLRE